MSDDRRCLVVDGHAVTRIGVRELLESEYEIEEAADLREAIETHTATGSFDVAVVELDTRPPDGEPVGPGIIKALRRAMPRTGIVALARSPQRHAANEALEAGASAYVAKSSPAEAIRTAVEAAADSGQFIDPAARQKANRAMLTRRQRETLQLLANGLSTEEVAGRLELSAETVRTHTKALLARLGARDRAHAVAIALRTGQID
ncbi:MAG: response regulator transcription factor [Actinomycetota bacterium]|nr:response regulator transcription factor [Actinomycetota bacterium]